MNEPIEKTEELVQLEDEIIGLIGEEKPDEETVEELLDDVYILGYEQAIKDMGEDPQDDAPEE